MKANFLPKKPMHSEARHLKEPPRSQLGKNRGTIYRAKPKAEKPHTKESAKQKLSVFDLAAQDKTAWQIMAGEASDTELRQIFKDVVDNLKDADGRRKEIKRLRDFAWWLGKNHANFAPKNLESFEKLTRLNQKIKDRHREITKAKEQETDRDAEVLTLENEDFELEYIKKGTISGESQIKTIEKESTLSPEKSVEVKEVDKIDAEIAAIKEMVKMLREQPGLSSFELENAYRDFVGGEADVLTEDDLRRRRLILLDSTDKQEKALNAILESMEEVVSQLKTTKTIDKETLHHLVEVNFSLEHDADAVVQKWIATHNDPKIRKAVDPKENKHAVALAKKLIAQGIATQELRETFDLPDISKAKAKAEAPYEHAKKRVDDAVLLEDLEPTGLLGQEEDIIELTDEDIISEEEEEETKTTEPEGNEELIDMETSEEEEEEEEEEEDGEENEDEDEELIDTEEEEEEEEEGDSWFANESENTSKETGMDFSDLSNDSNIESLKKGYDRLKAMIEEDSPTIQDDKAYLAELINFNWNEVDKKPSFFGQMINRFFGGSKRDTLLNNLTEALKLTESMTQVNKGQGRKSLTRIKEGSR